MTFELEFGQSLFGEVLVLLYIIYRQFIQYIMQVRTITLRCRRGYNIILLSIYTNTDKVARKGDGG